MNRRNMTMALGLAVVLIVGWLTFANTDVTKSAANPAVSPTTKASLTELLGKVKVIAALQHRPGYERNCQKNKACVFGPAWNDPRDYSGCDTRQRVLRAQLTDVTFKPGTHNCKVLTGVLHDPYSGTQIWYSASDPTAVEIDHVAPLARVWDLGAWAWTPQQRAVFANDTDNLLAVSGRLNTAKSDAGIAQWVPPNKAFVCDYIKIYVAVLVKYDLPITRAEHATAERDCTKNHV